MKKIGNSEITYQQFMYIIIGAMIGVGVLDLPNRLAKVSRQDAWVSAAIGGLYPLYIALLSIYVSRRFPKDNILSLSKKCFGRLIGSLLNIIFSIQFFIYLMSLTFGFISLARLYIVPFLTLAKLSAIILLLGLYGTFLGLKVIGRINEVVFYLLVVFLFFPLISLKHGSLLNISPILGSGIKNILKGSIESGFSYSGVEIILLIYPNVTDKSRLKSIVLRSVLIIVFIYTYLTFLTVYYAGPDVVLKPYWSVLLLNESINLPFINSFRFIFMYMWLIILFKTTINSYYGFTFSIGNSFIRFNIKKMCFIVYPFALYAVNKIADETTRRSITSKVMNYIIIFNVLFLALISIIAHFKAGEKNESS